MAFASLNTCCSRLSLGKTPEDEVPTISESRLENASGEILLTSFLKDQVLGRMEMNTYSLKSV